MRKILTVLTSTILLIGCGSAQRKAARPASARTQASASCLDGTVQLDYGWPGVPPGQLPSDPLAPTTIIRAIYTCPDGTRMTLKAPTARTDVLLAWPANFVADVVPPVAPQFNSGDWITLDIDSIIVRSRPDVTSPVAGFQSANTPGRITGACVADNNPNYGLRNYCPLTFVSGVNGWVPDEHFLPTDQPAAAKELRELLDRVTRLEAAVFPPP